MDTNYFKYLTFIFNIRMDTNYFKYLTFIFNIWTLTISNI